MSVIHRRRVGTVQWAVQCPIPGPAQGQATPSSIWIQSLHTKHICRRNSRYRKQIALIDNVEFPFQFGYNLDSFNWLQPQPTPSTVNTFNVHAFRFIPLAIGYPEKLFRWKVTRFPEYYQDSHKCLGDQLG